MASILFQILHQISCNALLLTSYSLFFIGVRITIWKSYFGLDEYAFSTKGKEKSSNDIDNKKVIQNFIFVHAITKWNANKNLVSCNDFLLPLNNHPSNKYNLKMSSNEHLKISNDSAIIFYDCSGACHATVSI